MAESGQGCWQTGGGGSRARQESVLYPVTHPLLPSACVWPMQSPCFRCSHSEAGHGALEVRLLELLAAGVVAGDQAGSSEAGWM